MTGKPIAAPGMRCPLWRKDVSKCCHQCAWFTQIRGKHPQTGEHLDQWMCAQVAVVLTTLEVGKATHEAGATTQALRNDLQTERENPTRLLASRPLNSAAPRALIEG